MTSLEAIIALFLAICMIERSASLSCPCFYLENYEELYCTPRHELACAPGSYPVPDSCGCCDVCAKIENEECGGPWYVLGVCAEGLICFDERSTGEVKPYVANIPAGTCQLPGYKPTPPAPTLPYWLRIFQTTPIKSHETTPPTNGGEEMNTPAAVTEADNGIKEEVLPVVVEGGRKPQESKKNDKKLKKLEKKARNQEIARQRKAQKKLRVQQRKAERRALRKSQRNNISNEIVPL